MLLEMWRMRNSTATDSTDHNKLPFNRTTELPHRATCKSSKIREILKGSQEGTEY